MDESNFHPMVYILYPSYEEVTADFSDDVLLLKAVYSKIWHDLIIILLTSHKQPSICTKNIEWIGWI